MSQQKQDPCQRALVRARRALARSEEKRRALEAPAALGAEVGPILHRLNNPLGVILGHGKRLLATATDETREPLGAIVRQAEALTALSRQVQALALGRGGRD